MDVTNDANGVCFPFDVLLDVLRRLPCRALARSRRVCRAWRHAVDAHKLQLRHFFPRGVFPGIFTQNFGCEAESSFFAPSLPPAPRHDGPSVFRRPLFKHAWASVLHHCNGLLLLEDEDSMRRYVCNPATVRCARLPPPKDHQRLYGDRMFLAFDPAVSRHHEVFNLPRGTTLEGEKRQVDHVPCDNEERKLDKVISACVFSSQTCQWVSREFVPGLCAPGDLHDMVTAPHPSRVKIWKTAEYWRGSLYVHCWNNVLMILRNARGTYDMAQLPGKAYDDDTEFGGMSELPRRSVLASYERGVHYVALDKCRLHVWTLTESDDGQIGWIPANQADFTPYDLKLRQCQDPKVLWEAVENNQELVSLFEPRPNIRDFLYGKKDGQSNTSEEDEEDEEYEEDEEEEEYEEDEEGEEDEEYEEDEEGEEDEEEEYEQEGDGDDDDDDDDDSDEEDEDNEYANEFKSEDSFWDSDEDNFIDLDETVIHDEDNEYGSYKILGLHPHKDVVLLETSSGIAAYHYTTSRMQYLGWRLVRDAHSHAHGIDAGFPYRPCYVDALSDN